MIAGSAAAAMVIGSGAVTPEGVTGLQNFVMSANAVDDVKINDANFPDAEFRNYVSENFDKDGDGSLSDEERGSVTEINVRHDWDYTGEKITSLQGIWAFYNLQYLDCSNNELYSLDVSNNTRLYYLDCRDNGLTSLDVSSNTWLKVLYCFDNQLANLDVSKNTSLTILSCHFNNLKVLDVKNNTALTGLSCHGNQLTNLDLSKNTALTQLSCGYDFVNGDGYAVHADNQLRSLDVSNNTALTYLYCSNNQLTSLNVSNNTALTELNCSNNQLTSLNVSKNTALTELQCNNNKLTSLDVSNNTELNNLIIEHNQLTSLDVSNNPELIELDCMGNKLTSLNTSNNKMLVELVCQLNQLTSLDVSKNTALTELCCWGNQLKRLDVSKNTALETLYCYQNQLTSLDLGNITNLDTLDCRFNQLSALDVSKNTALKELYCYRNQLTELDVSQNTALVVLSIGANKLTSLDLSNNSAFEGLIYYDDCVYETVMDTNTKSFDLSKMPNDFDVSKASEWKNAVYDSSTNKLANITSGTVTYIYDIGRECNIAESETEEGYYIFRNDNKVGFSIKFTNYKTVKSIAVVPPQVTPFFYTGDAFDPVGYTLKVTYDDNSTEVIALTAAMCSGFDSTKTGKQTITVTYEGKTAKFTVTVKEKEKESTDKFEIGSSDYPTIDAVVKQIEKDIKANKTFENGYTIVLPEKHTEAKAVTFPDVSITLKSDSASELTIPSITAKSSLTLENVSVKTAKGVAAAITVKKAFTAENSAFGKTTVTGHTDIFDCTIDGALTLNEKTGETKLTNVTVNGKAAVTNTTALENCTMGALAAKGILTVDGGEYESITVSAKAGTTTLTGDIKIAKNLTVSNDLVIDGNSEVGGKFTAKAALNINGFIVKNGK